MIRQAAWIDDDMIRDASTRLVQAHRDLYIVHMKHVTASQARQNWFRLLDEVAAGQVVVIERNGRRIVMKREASVVKESAPDYRKLIRGDVDDADTWSWSWSPTSGLRSIKKRK